MTSEIVVLRLVHILSGIFLAGSALFTTIFLMPVLSGAGQAAGQVLAGLQSRKLFIVLPTVALLTIVSGTRLMMVLSGDSAPICFRSRMGQTLSWSALAAIVAFLLSLLVPRPAAVRAGRLSAELEKTTDEARRAKLSASVARLRQWGGLAGKLSMVLVLIAAAGMSVARYL